MERKYEFTEETMTHGEVTLHRIRALRDFDDVKKRDLGGWIEKEENLSHEGDCWVYDVAIVRDNSSVSSDAKIRNSAVIAEKAWVGGLAEVYDSAIVLGEAEIHGYAKVSEKSIIADRAEILGSARVYGSARVREGARVTDEAEIFGHADVRGNSDITENAIVCGTAEITSKANIGYNARIVSDRDYLTVGPIGSRNDHTTFYRTADGDIYVCCGCFNDSLETFKEQVVSVHGGTIFEVEYLATIEYVKKILEYEKKITKERTNEKKI